MHPVMIGQQTKMIGIIIDMYLFLTYIILRNRF